MTFSYIIRQLRDFYKSNTIFFKLQFKFCKRSNPFSANYFDISNIFVNFLVYKCQSSLYCCELSTQSVNFLDITMDLKNNNYQPYRKDNAKEIYVNYNSNHPYMIKKEIPNMTQKRPYPKPKTFLIKQKNPTKKL